MRTERSPPRKTVALAAGVCGMMFLAAAVYVIRVQDDQGEIVVESQIDGVTVSIKRDGGSSRSDWKIHQGENRWTVRSGKIEIELPADATNQFAVSDKSVLLSRGAEAVVKIERKPRALAPDATKPPAGEATPVIPASEQPGDADRHVAEWVLRKGGKVTLCRADEELLEWNSSAPVITKIDDLPDKPFCLAGVDLFRVTGLTDDNLPDVSSLPNLLSIELSGTGIGDKTIGRLASMHKLYYLGASDTSVSDQALRLITNLQRLRDLTIQRTKTTDEGLYAIRNLPLYSIVVDSSHLTKVGIQHLIAVELTTLTFNGDDNLATADIERIAVSFPACNNWFAITRTWMTASLCRCRGWLI